MTDIGKTAALITPLLGSVTRPRQCGEVVDVGEAVYLKSDGKYWLADADTAAEAQAAGIVTAIGAYGKLTSVAGDMIDVTFSGPVEGFSSLTPGQLLYSSTTPGAIEDSAPAGSSGDFLWIIGFAFSATEIFVRPFTSDLAAQ